jgi:hypothetical protein
MLEEVRCARWWVSEDTGKRMGCEGWGDGVGEVVVGEADIVRGEVGAFMDSGCAHGTL